MRLLGEATDRAHGREIWSITKPRSQDRIRQGAEPSRRTPEAGHQLDPERSDHHCFEQALDRGRPSEPDDEDLLRDCLVKSVPIVPQRNGTPADHDPGRRRQRLERPQSPTNFRCKKLDVFLPLAWEEWFVERFPRADVEGFDRVEPRPKALDRAANCSRGEQEMSLGQPSRISLSLRPYAASPMQDEEEKRGPREIDRPVPLE
jgi:hypothetical protein